MKTKWYGYKSIMVVLFLEIILATIFYNKSPFFTFIIVFLLFDLILLGLIRIKPEEIRIYTMSSIFNGVHCVALNQIEEIHLRGENSMTPGRMDVYILTKNGEKYFFFMLLYPFERRKMEMQLENSGVRIKSI